MPVEVEKRVEVVVTPTPMPVPPPGPRIYKLGIFEEPLTRNYWNYFGGPGASVWTGYVLNPVTTSLYGYSDQRFDWVPIVADGFPSPLIQETVDGKVLWTSRVKLRKGLKWSDGVEITAHDFAFVVDTVQRLQLGGNYASAIDEAFVDHVEALDSHTAKVFFKGSDQDGNAQTPGLSKWQFGLALAPILPKHYWEPIVESAVASSDDVAERREALFAHVPEGQPTGGGYVFDKWEPGAFFEHERDTGWFNTGTRVIEYENGAYRETNAALGYDVTFYGEATGPTALEFEVGPHADSEIFRKGFHDRVRDTPDLSVLSNTSNGFRYLGFNVRKPPMDIKQFRQAVATVIDKEFVSDAILQSSAIPVYSVVPEGNGFWFNNDIPRIGKGLTRAERVAQAVDLLKQAGFTYETEPKVSEDGNFVEVQGKGLRMPDGTPVPELEIMGSSAGYDPLRATFNIWIQRWLNDIGIPVKARLASVNVIIGVMVGESVATELDMWILGWSLEIFPDYLELFFNNRHAPENEGGGFNWGGYSNPAYDELSLALLMETDIGRARTTVSKLQEFLADELPYVPLFTTPILDTYRPGRVEFPYIEVLGGVQFLQGLQQVVLIK